METTRAYLMRKNEELAFLYGLLETGAAAPQAATCFDVFRMKLSLRAELLAASIRASARLVETNSRPSRDRSFGPYTLHYLYQRYDVRVSGPPVYGAPGGVEGPPLMRTERYMSSGMGALSAVLLAVDRARPGSVVYGLDDLYFETGELLRDGPSGLAPQLVQSLDALVDALTLGTPAARGLRVLLVDSISGVAPGQVLGAVSAGWVDLVLVDTTCLAIGSEAMSRVVDGAMTLGVPTVLLRSHQKLDFMGVEYGRLGSAVFLSSPMFPPEAHRLVSELVDRAGTFTRLLGSAVVPHHLAPFVHVPDFQRLNRRRVAHIQAANRRAAETARSRLTGEVVGCPPHGLFFNLGPFPGHQAGFDILEARVETLAATAAQEGLPVRRATSFGLDFTAVMVYPATPSTWTLRVSMADLPMDMVDAIADLVARWCAGTLD